MPVNILMPALSPTMEKGNLAKWLKKEGDKVKAGDVIAEIETDKATMEYESIDDGVLAKIVVPEGTQDVSVNQLIAVLAQEGEDPKAAAAAAGKGARRAASKPSNRRRDQPAPDPLTPALSPAGRGSRRGRSPAARSRALPRPKAERVGVRGLGRQFGHPRLRLAAGAAAGQGRRHRPRAHPGLRPARARHRARRRGGEIGQAASSRRAAPAAAAAPAVAPSMSDQQDPRAVRRRQLRGRPARRHAPHHRAAADRRRCRPSRIST